MELARSVFLLLLKVSPSGVWVCVLACKEVPVRKTIRMRYISKGHICMVKLYDFN